MKHRQLATSRWQRLHRGSWILAALLSMAPAWAELLTPAERAWLNEHPEIRIGLTEVPPLVLPNAERSEFRGITMDYLAALEQQIGTRIQRVYLESWKDVLAAARERRIDMIFAAVRTPDREAFLNFPRPYIDLENRIIVKSGSRFEQADLSHLDGHTVAALADSGVHEFLRKQYPRVVVLPTRTELDVLSKVSFGEADAGVLELARATYYIAQNGITNLKVAGGTGYNYALTFANRNDWPELTAIIDKGLAAIPAQEREQIYRRWVALSVDHPMSRPETWYVLGALLALILTVVLWNHTLRLQVERRTQEMRHELNERQRAEQALQDSEYRFRILFERSPLAMLIADQHTHVQHLNSRFTELFGYTTDELHDINDWWPRAYPDPEYRQTVRDGWTHATERARNETGNITPVEAHITCRDGSVRIMEVFGTDIGQQTLILFHDVTERRIAEQQLREARDELENRVAARTAELQQTNDDLTLALDRLERTRDELVRGERLASLGSLVAGVAHELNTPIGNSVTVASSFLEKTQNFIAEVRAGTLRRSTLDGYLNDADNAAGLIMRNLTRAHELIAGFKQVAVDQTTEHRRLFDLRTVIEEVVATLVPVFKKTPYRIETGIDADIEMDSFPGPLGQIVTNLCGNALQHGFDERPSGTVRILGQRQDAHTVRIDICDDGHGISQENLPRIFDPFFTTRMGRGGTGLGLHIVYNLAQRVLGGRIEVSSPPEGGTCFTLTLPVQAPREASTALVPVVPVKPAASPQTAQAAELPAPADPPTT